MFLLGINTENKIIDKTKERGSSVVEFVLCLPVVIAFFYGVVFINNYFEKGSNIKIINRSVALSLEEDTELLYKTFLDMEEKDSLDNNDKNNKEIFSIKITKEKDKSKISDKIFGEDLTYHSSIYALENKYNGSTFLPFMLHHQFKSYLKINEDEEKLFNMKSSLYSLLNAGYLNNNDYLNVGIFGGLVGFRSLWSSRFIDECLMNFDIHTSCNGTNYFRSTIEAAATSKTIMDICTFGTTSVISEAIGTVVDTLMDEVLEVVVDKIEKTLEDKVKDKIYEKIEDNFKEICDYE